MSALILIPKVVNIIKLYVPIDRWIPLICVCMGIALSFLAEWARVNPDVAWVTATVVVGFVLGLAAMGNRSADNSMEHKANEAALKQTAGDDQTVTTATMVATPEKVTTEVEVTPIGDTNGQ
jgi:hypothetical protein